MKIAIIGSGISGVTAGRMLSKDHEVVIFEKNSLIGGLIKCERLPEGLFHRVGGHVFNSKNPAVLDWFWSHFNKDEEFIQVKRKARVLFNNKIIGYPIENHLYMLDKPVVSNIIKEIIDLQDTVAKNPLSYPDFEAFLRSNFGDTLFEIYFEPYNKKIWQVDLKTVSMEWLEGKLPMPDYREVILSNILREEEDSMVHSRFYYPKTGGSQFLIDRLSNGLDIHRNCQVSELRFAMGKFELASFNGFDKIIYTGDVRQLPLFAKDQLSANSVDLNGLEALRSNGTSNLFCQTDDIDISWLYIPQNFTKAHRIIYTGNFADSNNGISNRKTCVVEFSGKVSPELMKQEVKKLPGNLTPVSYNYEPNSYIVHDQQTRQLMIKVKSVLEDKGIYLLGRFAEWEYYNMDKCMESCFSIVAKINNN